MTGNASTAVLSDDRAYRYFLSRETCPDQGVEPIGGSCLFIMLNPSTADETVNDATIRKCIGFTRLWGFNRLEVVNLYAYRATNPKRLADAEVYNPIGDDNDRVILDAANQAKRIVCAWGNHGTVRGKAVRWMLEAAQLPVSVLGLTKTGEPKHPLYVPYAARPVRWEFNR